MNNKGIQKPLILKKTIALLLLFNMLIFTFQRASKCYISQEELSLLKNGNEGTHQPQEIWFLWTTIYAMSWWNVLVYVTLLFRSVPKTQDFMSVKVLIFCNKK